MKYSKLFGKTVKTAKRDMKFDSHKLLYRGGFVRELSTGRYEFLPLGLRVWSKIVNLVDEEMEKIGSQRVSIPILQPIDVWKKTNRDSAWGSSLMKITDRNDAEFALSATGEGVITEMVAKEKPTYKDLPIVVHQFIIKFRDELRPRGGLLRVREFVMKDAYSYNVTEKDFMKTYGLFQKAYLNICDSLNLDYHVVIADNGALGGDYGHEIQVPCEIGEDKIVVCDKCKYAANTEMAEFERDEVNKEEPVKDYKEAPLPYEVGTIKQLVEHFDMPENRFIKNVVYKTAKGKLIIATITGDLDVNEAKLTRLVDQGDLVKAEDEDIKKIGARHGTVHSWGYDEHKKNIIFVVDDVIPKARNLYGGYKTDTTDPQNVNYGRDFESDIVGDIAEPFDGAKCKQCSGGKLRLIRTVEFGHLFKYDHFYTEKHDGYYVDKNGKNKLMYSGAYGIGIGRAVALVAEKHHDDNGLVWPKSISPYDVHLIDLPGGEGKKVYDQLVKAGIEVLWDDRDVSAGTKFADADLIGIPVRLVTSGKTKGKVEWKNRDSGKLVLMELPKVAKRFKE